MTKGMEIYTKVSFVFNNRIARFFVWASKDRQLLFLFLLIYISVTGFNTERVNIDGSDLSYILQFNKNCVCEFIWNEIDDSIDIKIHYKITEDRVNFERTPRQWKRDFLETFPEVKNRKKKQKEPGLASQHIIRFILRSCQLILDLPHEGVAIWARVWPRF